MAPPVVVNVGTRGGLPGQDTCLPRFRRGLSGRASNGWYPCKGQIAPEDRQRIDATIAVSENLSLAIAAVETAREGAKTAAAGATDAAGRAVSRSRAGAHPDKARGQGR